jgi:ribosome-binding protein aMBF1 (putative translation factor)
MRTELSETPKPARYGGADRISTKTKLAEQLKLLGDVLVRARERAGLKQFEVASRLVVPASYLSKIENGTRRLDVIELIQIAEAIGVDAADIVREVENELGR